MVSRNVVALTADTGRAGFLPRMQFFGEAQRGFGSAEDELAWDIKLGGVLELYRSSGRWSLVGIAGHEMTANPFNSIGFNPRGALWEEMLLVTRRGAAFDWYVGAFHRCRHEVDNSHPPDESGVTPGYVPTARLLTLSGLQLAILAKERSLGTGTRLSGFARLERYANTTDDRTPRNTAAPYWKRALGGTSAGGRIARGGGPGQLYALAWGSLMYFSRGPAAGGIDANANWRTEIGARARGPATAFDVYAAFESTFDDVTRPTPQPSRLIALGIRFGAP